MRSTTVSAPATIANLGSGFDTLGIAVELRNIVTIEENDRFEVVEKGTPVSGKDMVTEIVKDFLEKNGYPPKVRILKTSAIPARKGLGSSSAAIVSALAAAMSFLNKLDLDKLFEMAVEIEGHPDNVAPAVYGGLRVSASISDRTLSLPVNVPFNEITVFVPPFETSTKEAREVLPKEIPFSQAIFNLQRLAILIAGASQGKILREGFEDELHQSKRLSLCRESRDFFEHLKSNAYNPVFVCGSGPSIGMVDRTDIKEPDGWRKMLLKVSMEGLKDK